MLVIRCLAIDSEFAASTITENKDRYPTVRDLLKKIRFLTLTPQQFAEGPATSSLLMQAESFAILLNISSSSAEVPMPEGFSQSTVLRKKNVGRSSFEIAPELSSFVLD